MPTGEIIIGNDVHSLVHTEKKREAKRDRDKKRREQKANRGSYHSSMSTHLFDCDAVTFSFSMSSFSS